MVVPTVNKSIPLENPPETSVPGQEIGSPEQANIQTSGDQSNGVAAKQSEQEATASPAGTSTGSPAPEESVRSAEALNKEVQSQEAVAAAEELVNQEVKLIFAEAEAPREELREVAEKNPDDPEPSAPEDVGANNKYEKTASEGQKNTCLDTAQEEHVSGDVDINVATQNENIDKEPDIVFSKAIQSKGTTKCEGPPVSTHHLSGWFKQGLLLHLLTVLFYFVLFFFFGQVGHIFCKWY